MDFENPELIEQLAALEHRQWAGWMKYMFSRGKMHVDGRFTIPADLVERWSRQLETNYKDLPENEKESDRVEARKVLKVLSKFDPLSPKTAGE